MDKTVITRKFLLNTKTFKIVKETVWNVKITCVKCKRTEILYCRYKTKRDAKSWILNAGRPIGVNGWHLDAAKNNVLCVLCYNLQNQVQK